MLQFTIQNQTIEAKAGTTPEQLAQKYYPQEENNFLLASINGKLCELNTPLQKSGTLQFLTYQSQAGRQSYQRSVLFLFIKAFYSEVGLKNHPSVQVEFGLGSGLFVRPKSNCPLTPELIERVQKKMEEYVKKGLPISKTKMKKDDAIDLFNRVNMVQKAALFRSRVYSWVNIYSIGNFQDYFYGYMINNTRKLKYFKLYPWDDGVIIQLPTIQNPHHISPPNPASWSGLYKTLKETEDWSAKLEVPSIGALNDSIGKQAISDLILVQEALQEKKIGDIAAHIKNDKRIRFILIAGPSSSGKTSFANRLSIQLQANGLHPHLISADNYFVEESRTPRHPDGSFNFEDLHCVDLEQFGRDMNNLLDGKEILLPTFNFTKRKQEFTGETLKLGENDVLIIEGIHCLNDKMTATLPAQSKYRIYISALTSLNIDEHNHIPTADVRLLRRIIRDARTRGSSVEETIAMWPSVRKGEEENIFPFQESADIMFNSACVYELPMLKLYAEPLLFQVPPTSPQYSEARRLLRFLSYSLSCPPDLVPSNSLVREFIGGSCFKV